jgi:hypothetical protein
MVPSVPPQDRRPTTVGGIKEIIALEHGNKDPQKSIGDTAQCAGV